MEETKYSGEIVSMSMKNEKNIKSKTKKAHGNIKKKLQTPLVKSLMEYTQLKLPCY